MPTACGLDFGTSNSTLGAVGVDGVPHLVGLEDDKTTIPSVIFFSFEDGQTYFGRKALAEYVSGAEGRLMRALKSVLGTSLINDVTRVKARQIAFTEIIGLFLERLRARAQQRLDTALDSVVVGRPVHFVDDDEVADRAAQAQLEKAVRAQGFRHVAFQFEPIAAALDYERHAEGEELTLIIDIGGGTSDFSVVRVSPERARSANRSGDILATAGVHIGGTDFDRLLSMAKVMPELGHQTPTEDGKRLLPTAPYYDLATWHRINRLYTQKTVLDLKDIRYHAKFPKMVDRMIAIVEDRQGHRLAGAVEEAKIALTADERTLLDFHSRGVDLSLPVDRAELGDAIAEAVGRVVRTIGVCLKRAGIGAPAVQTLILTGGSTQIPAIMAELHRLFPQARFVESDAFGSVGLGLALDAARKF